MLLLTDGLIEGRAATGGSARLGMDGLIALLAGVRAGASWAQEPSTLVADLIDAVLELNGGAMLDDVAALLLDGRAERRLMRRSRLSAGAWLALSAGVLSLATLVALAAALIASHHLTQARARVVDRVDVATNTALVLSNAMVNQETGVRGFVLGGDEQFLDPYRTGVANAGRAPAPAPGPGAGGDGRPAAGRSGRCPARHRALAVRLRAAHDRAHPPLGAGRIETPRSAAGKARFDAVRVALATAAGRPAGRSRQRARRPSQRARRR